ncbi:MAG: N-6 DNA methylase [Planctomycetaceae bacterium]|nr:N-6 DNA methylase [Planctomycetaceae bacterium]
MPKEFFSYPETAPIFTRLEEASQRSGVSRGQCFEDFLTMSVCCLSGGRMEDLYLQTVAKHTSGKPGKRGCDSLAHMFGELVAAMEQDTREGMKDILGDLFEGAITYGEHQQYLTPMPVCEMMARLTVGEGGLTAPPDELESEAATVESSSSAQDDSVGPTERKTVYDPCSGSGRMLLAVAQINRHWEFVGRDVDLRCVRMTALNLAFRSLYGHAIWGNTLALEQKLVYRTGFDGRGFLREVPLDMCPVPVQQVIREPTRPSPTETSEPLAEDASSTPKGQLRLF